MMPRNVMVVVAHPDDEVLGCGGTIAKHVAQNDLVHVLFLSSGVGSRDEISCKEKDRRISSAKKSQKILGVTTTSFLDFPDNRFDSVALLDVVKEIEVEIRSHQPEIIYTHHAGDLNIDHRVTYQAVLTACRPTAMSSIKRILSFEVMSSTEWAGPHAPGFFPNWYVDISEFVDLKMQALKSYNHEMRTLPNSRCYEHILALVQHRGNSVGAFAAEAFSLIRNID